MADLVKLSPSVVGGAVECNEDQTSDSSNSRVGRSVCWLIIISVLWLATRPYYGSFATPCFTCYRLFTS